MIPWFLVGLLILDGLLFFTRKDLEEYLSYPYVSGMLKAPVYLSASGLSATVSIFCSYSVILDFHSVVVVLSPLIASRTL